MDDKHRDAFLNFLMEYSPYIVMAGAVVGAVEFCNSNITSLFEALFIPVATALGFVFASWLIMMGVLLLDSLLDTERKRFWGAAAVVIIATIVTVTHVL